MERIRYLYKITNIENNKIYIGQTVQPEKRWYQHKYDSSKNNHPSTLAYAIKKYGNMSFNFEVIACCKTLDEANDIETILVEQYDSHVSNNKGYNISLGGRTAPITDDVKKKMSAAKKGKKLSPEHSKKISESNKGRVASNKGIPRSDEEKNKISKSSKGKIFTDEHKNNLSQARKRYVNKLIKDRSSLGE